MKKYTLIMFIAFILSGCKSNKEKQLNDFLVKHDFTIFWYINDFAKYGIDKYSTLKWNDCNKYLKQINIIGIKNNRDNNEYLIVERYDRLFNLEILPSPNRIFLKKGSMLYFYGPSSNTIKTNIIIDFEAEKKKYKSFLNALDIEDSIVSAVTFKENLLKNGIIKPVETFVLTSAKKDSLEFFHTSENNRFIIRWYYSPRMGYNDSLLELQDSIVIE